MKKAKLQIRAWTEKDLPAIAACYRESYPEYQWREDDERIYREQFNAFPLGQFLAMHGEQVVGFATSLIVQIVGNENAYNYDEITGAETFSTHDPSGDTLYGADIMVHPDFRGQRIAGKLYEKRRGLVKRYNLYRMVAYGRIPGYHDHAGKLTPNQYVEKVCAGELSDSALNAHLKAGYSVKTILLRMSRDDRSLDYSTLLEWLNPDYNREKRKIASNPVPLVTKKVRVCAAQYLMRRISTWDEFEQTVRFFVETADQYHCHFLVMPELFTAQLLATMPRELDWNEARILLSSFTDRYLALFSKLAVEKQLYIIGGSHIVARDDQFFNVAHLFAPNGDAFTQDKLHITPQERKDWGISPGMGIRAFHTPLARIGIQVGYDVEFPEIPRLLARAGVDILFVPFSTDDKVAYKRIRVTAQCRAVENNYYVVIAGNVGNLPTIPNYLINYAQSAVFTPSDVGFPPGAVAAESDPNVETVVISELDLTTLALQREVGSVRPFFDQRPDLYTLKPVDEVEIVNVVG